MRVIILFIYLLLASCAALRAQNCGATHVTRRGDTLLAPEAASYQWLRNGAEIPGATQRFYVPPTNGEYAVRLRSLTSDPLDYTPGPPVVVTGAVLDEFLRPISGVEVRISGTKTHTDGDGRFYVTTERAARLTARATLPGYHAHTVGFMPTAADTQFVYVHLAKQVVTHKLLADSGGTISQGGFWLTLPPNAVVDADGKPYTGEIHLSVVARRPGDRDFSQRMPGGDFIAVDAGGVSKVLYSYGFTGVELTTTKGEPLKLAPGQKATIEFLIAEDQRPDAPGEMPMWHFDEVAGSWKEAGVVRKAGLTYRADVEHFSWWNVDVPYAPAYIEFKVVDCKGKPVAGYPVQANQWRGCTDAEGRFKGPLPIDVPIRLLVGPNERLLEPFSAAELRDLGTFDVGWGVFMAFGLADSLDVLTVYAFGETEGVEYSLDGENWQREPVFVLQGDTLPARGWARQAADPDCGVFAFENILLPRHGDCPVHSLDELQAFPKIWSADDLWTTTEPVYSVGINTEDMTNHMKDWIEAMPRHRCVQTASIDKSMHVWFEPEEVEQGIEAITTFWLNLKILSSKYNRLPASIENLTLLEALELRDSEIAALPSTIGNLARLKSLNLGNTLLAALPESLGNLALLEELNAGSSQLTDLPDSFINLTALKTLNLSLNQLTRLPADFGNLDSLKTFYIYNNSLTELPDSFGNLSALETFEAPGNQLTGLPAGFGNLAKLKRLSLNDNKISNFPASFGNLKSLTHLYIGANELAELPASFGDLSALEQLDAGYNQLTTLPASISQLGNLKTMFLNGNQFSILPEEVGGLPALEYLEIKYCPLLTGLHESLGNLSTLKRLSADQNQLTALPASFGNLGALDYLTLNNNQVTELPASFGNLSRLRTLVMTSNKLTTLPESFCGLSRLESLHLTDNQLAELPACLGDLDSLEFIYMERNKLRTLPASFGDLSNLEYAAFEGNQLTALPASIGNLPKLGYLNLQGNQLTALPASMADLADTLYRLVLYGNPISAEEIARIRAMLPDTDIAF